MQRFHGDPVTDHPEDPGDALKAAIETAREITAIILDSDCVDDPEDLPLPFAEAFRVIDSAGLLPGVDEPVPEAAVSQRELYTILLEWHELLDNYGSRHGDEDYLKRLITISSIVILSQGAMLMKAGVVRLTKRGGKYGFQ